MMESLRQRVLGSGIARWYRAREPKEQQVIGALAILLGLTLLWLIVWKPISDWRVIAHNRYQNAQVQLDWMRANEARARALAASGRGAERELTRVITGSAQAQGIQVNRLQPESNGVVSVSIQGQAFNDVLRWLHQLQENNGVTVMRFAADAEERPGFVNVQVRLQ